jgi:hypothetical protein
MAGTNQFYPIATDSSANVLSNASWQASNTRQTGFRSGIMPSNGLNVALRQGTVLSSAIGAFIAQQGYDALDNGDLATLTANFRAALKTVVLNTPQRNNTVSYTTNGAFSWTVPAGVSFVYVRLVGAGGGACGGNNGNNYSAGGGGSGGYSEGWVAVNPGQIISIIIGKGGTAAGGGNPTIAGGGGSTSFGSYISATGGGGGKTGSNTSAGGAPGLGSGGQFNAYGSPGGDGNPYNAQAQGGYGAASAFGGGGRTSTDGIDSAGRASGSGAGGVWGNTGSAGFFGSPGADGALYIQY